MKEIIIFTDGACKGNPGKGGWGFYAEASGQAIECFGGELKTTNNIMEMTAAIKAINWAAVKYPGVKISLYTDSTYLLKGVTEWMKNWIKNGWTNSAGKPVKNKELWAALHRLDSANNVRWIKVKAHAGIAGNERADSLANKGVLHAN